MKKSKLKEEPLLRDAKINICLFRGEKEAIQDFVKSLDGVSLSSYCRKIILEHVNGNVINKKGHK